MKMLMIAVAMLTTTTAFAVEKTITTTTTAPAAVTTSSALAPNTLAFNFVALSQGKTNVYFDIGGMSERVTPSLSFRSYSNKEKRPQLNNDQLTVDRSIATLGASVAVVKSEGKSLILNPYLYFGTEKDAINTTSKNGIGARVVGQMALNKTISVQGGVDANSMEETFKGEAYIGLAFAL